jgi:phosphoribosylanthranilate isomerase
MEVAAKLMAQVPPDVDTVVVVGRPSLPELLQIHSRLAPRWIQIMADALPPVRDRAGLRLIPAFEDGPDLGSRVAAYAEESGESIPLILVDGPRPGSGIQADWSRVVGLSTSTRLVLAGGIRADNVAAAIARVQPHGVDLSSGVERERGIKDAGMIREFMTAVRAVEVDA